MQATLRLEQVGERAETFFACRRQLARIGDGLGQVTCDGLQFVVLLEFERVEVARRLRPRQRLARLARVQRRCDTTHVDEVFEFAAQPLKLLVVARHRACVLDRKAQLFLDLRIRDHRLADQPQQFVDHRGWDAQRRASLDRGCVAGADRGFSRRVVVGRDVHEGCGNRHACRRCEGRLGRRVDAIRPIENPLQHVHRVGGSPADAEHGLAHLFQAIGRTRDHFAQRARRHCAVTRQERVKQIALTRFVLADESRDTVDLDPARIEDVPVVGDLKGYEFHRAPSLRWRPICRRQYGNWRVVA